MAGLPVLLLEGSPGWAARSPVCASDGPDGRHRGGIDTGPASGSAALVEALGLGEQLVHPTAATSRILVDGRAVELPPSALGVPGMSTRWARC